MDTVSIDQGQGHIKNAWDTIALQDPLSLLPWLQSLFDLADAGMTTFEVSGPFYPYTNLRGLFASDNTASYYEGVEKILGTFKRR